MDTNGQVWFNRCYFWWFSEVYKRSPEVARQCDFIVVGELGSRQARDIIKETPYTGGDKVDYLLCALEKSHWGEPMKRGGDDKRTSAFTEVSQSPNQLHIAVADCQFQADWKRAHNEYCFCSGSHNNFLWNFCRTIGEHIKADIRVRYVGGDPKGCAWDFIIRRL